MENLLYGHNCTKVYYCVYVWSVSVLFVDIKVFDLKGSMRGRYVAQNPKKPKQGDVLMDENYLECKQQALHVLIN